MDSLSFQHGVPALVWSETVANSAQTWADKCIFQHSGYGYGENLAWGHQSIEEAIADWYNEIHSYNWYNPGFSMGTGHFTQMVWKTSQASDKSRRSINESIICVMTLLLLFFLTASRLR